MFASTQHNGQGGGGSGFSPRPGPVDTDDPNGLLGELYAELRARAGRFMRGQPRDLTLQTTALVHEACLKIFGCERLESGDRSHILALASSAMRSVLVDHARARSRVKRSPPGERVPLDELRMAYEERAVDLLALDEALKELATFDSEMARAVELHFFGGLSLENTARALDMPVRTLERRWAATRAWLRAEMG
jgi:RNA polymerase sigma factor (TIGR02999 family)